MGVLKSKETISNFLCKTIVNKVSVKYMRFTHFTVFSQINFIDNFFYINHILIKFLIHNSVKFFFTKTLKNIFVSMCQVSKKLDGQIIFYKHFK